MKQSNNRYSEQTRFDKHGDPIAEATDGGSTGVSIGTAIGAAVGGWVGGAIAGKMSGKNGTLEINPAIEDAYWEDEYPNRPYARETVPYEAYQPAYQVGYQGYARYPGKTYDEVKSELRRDYEKARGSSSLNWDKAKKATRDAWNRVDCAQDDAYGNGR